MRENSNINKALAYYIGYSTDDLIRYKASSGGIGTSIIKYLLSTSEYDTSMTFVYDKEKCGYIPKLIYDFNEINICGSVYQDIDIFSFLKENISSIKNGIIVTCMPCQVQGIRSVLDRNNINNFIISKCLKKRQKFLPAVSLNIYIINLRSLLKLRIIKVSIETVSCKKLIMSSLLNDITILHNKYHISIFDG